VREVEEALLGLDTTAAQEQDARLALDRSRSALEAVGQREKRGLASALQVEDALRRSLSAEAAWLDLQRNRVGAWVVLYRAVGGGYSFGTNSPSAERAAHTSIAAGPAPTVTP